MCYFRSLPLGDFFLILFSVPYSTLQHFCHISDPFTITTVLALWSYSVEVGYSGIRI